MIKAPLALAFAILLSAALGHDTRLAASPVKNDEQVVLFPVAAARQANGSWKVPAHVWVFEPDNWSSIKPVDDALMRALAKQMGINDIGDRAATLAERAKWFAVDNERGKQVTVEMGAGKWTLGKTGSNGHGITEILLPGPAEGGARLSLQVRLPADDTREFQGQVHFIPPAGVSVISDIDDTIKISNVLDKKQLLKNTFLEELVVAPGMPERYAKMKARGTYFHYVSASPWQLWPSLAPFIAEHYPLGTVSMRHFRLKDSSFVDFLLKPSGDYKLAAIGAIIHRYPDHKFILIGDSGECDPEIYGKVFRKFPRKVQKIMIRRVATSDFGASRLEDAFKEVPKHTWQLIGADTTIGAKACNG